MTDTDLFTQAAAAREVGVTRAAVTNRLTANKFKAGDTAELAGSTFITRLGIKRWKAERAAQAKKLLGMSDA
ncbi:MAG TPA: hypothetical protein VGI97_14670 [Gemmatimonadaceae bacterium]|jgi:hypothetical protein